MSYRARCAGHRRHTRHAKLLLDRLRQPAVTYRSFTDILKKIWRFDPYHVPAWVYDAKKRNWISQGRFYELVAYYGDGRDLEGYLKTPAGVAAREAESQRRRARLMYEDSPPVTMFPKRSQFQ